MPHVSDTPASNKTDTDQDEGKAEPLNTEDIENLLNQASESLDEAAGGGSATGAAPDSSGPSSSTNPPASAGASAEPQPFNLGDLAPETAGGERQPMDLLGEVEMDLRVELGRTQMRLEEVLQLRSGSVVALDKLAGDPVDIFVNGRLIAHGEVLVMNDNFCVRVTELVGA